MELKTYGTGLNDLSYKLYDGKIRNVITKKDYRSIKYHLIKNLSASYRPKNVKIEFYSAKQRPDEDVEQFGHRLLNYMRELSEEDKKEVEKHLTEVFIDGRRNETFDTIGEQVNAVKSNSDSVGKKSLINKECIFCGKNHFTADYFQYKKYLEAKPTKAVRFENTGDKLYNKKLYCSICERDDHTNASLKADSCEGENTAEQNESLNINKYEILSEIFTTNVSTGVEIEINGKVSECLIDTGAFTSFISLDYFNSYNISKFTEIKNLNRKKWITANGRPLEVVGETELEL
ncbi:hypothetical protein BpHYR1_051839 [Brachionus plicatilis]|uniref:Uncharacterized protein n=1 Tax=Brachionus plicatilis TaxID=10195 RepID=A0A3M7T1S8_BRAPC|nr:hypothetical protein BpHYR1_051839 [Brachionus plicatilis]